MWFYNAKGALINIAQYQYVRVDAVELGTAFAVFAYGDPSGPLRLTENMTKEEAHDILRRIALDIKAIHEKPGMNY